MQNHVENLCETHIELLPLFIHRSFPKIAPYKFINKNGTLDTFSTCPQHLLLLL